MKKILSILTLCVYFFIFAAPGGVCAQNKQISADIKTKRAPEGTIIPLKTSDTAGSKISSAGSNVYLTVSENIIVDDIIVIPEGSIVRGFIEYAEPAARLYKSGSVKLHFDHIVSISGRQVPFYAVICNRKDASYDGVLSSGETYSDAFRKTVQNTKNIASKPVKWVWERTGAPKYVFAPVTAVFSGAAAGVYFVYDTIADVFKKGNDITVNQGDIIQVKLVKPLDMPVF